MRRNCFVMVNNGGMDTRSATNLARHSPTGSPPQKFPDFLILTRPNKSTLENCPPSFRPGVDQLCGGFIKILVL